MRIRLAYVIAVALILVNPITAIHGSAEEAKTHPSLTAVQAKGVQYSVNELLGNKVVNADNGTIGSVSDLVIDADGKVAQILVSIGGFLGIGERVVALPPNSLEIRRTDHGLSVTFPRRKTVTKTGGMSGEDMLKEYPVIPAGRRGRK